MSKIKSAHKSNDPEIQKAFDMQAEIEYHVENGKSRDAKILTQNLLYYLKQYPKAEEALSKIEDDIFCVTKPAVDSNFFDVLDAIDHGCSFNNDGYAIDDFGNEWRNEDGNCVLLTESVKNELKKKKVNF